MRAAVFSLLIALPGCVAANSDVRGDARVVLEKYLGITAPLSAVQDVQLDCFLDLLEPDQMQALAVASDAAAQTAAIESIQDRSALATCLANAGDV